jgi:hypothetical protein
LRRHRWPIAAKIGFEVDDDRSAEIKKNNKMFIVVAPNRPHKLVRPWSQIIGIILVSSDRSHVTSGYSSGYAAAAGFVSLIATSGTFPLSAAFLF